MEIHFETEGIEPVPNTINSDVPMKEGDIIYHQNPEHHIYYKIINIKYIVDDYDEQFYQVASLQTVE